tara:strand:+ start:770 stop:1621 length:852 start_codon:yes stop_codon:yes gene_type:complete
MKIKPHLDVIKQAADLLGADTTEGAEFLKKVVGGYWESMAEKPAKAAYQYLTDLKGGKKNWTSTDFFTNTLNQRPELRPVDDLLNPLQKMGRVGRGSRKEIKEIMKKGNPLTDVPTTVFQEDILGAGSPTFAARVTKTPDKGWGWTKPIYDNPELSAKIVGGTVAAGVPLTAGAFLTAYADSSKPRSEYAYPVEPTRGSYDETGGVAASSNKYNPSVESARVSAQLKHDLEEQKFRHKVALQEMRDESRTPGVQGSPSPMSGGSFDIGSALGNIYGNRNTNYL